MPFPNRAQWVVIWATVLISGHFWLRLHLSNWMPSENGWGLAGYLHPALEWHPERLAAVVLVLGALLVWQFSHWQFRRRQLWLL